MSRIEEDKVSWWCATCAKHQPKRLRLRGPVLVGGYLDPDKLKYKHDYIEEE